MQSCECTAAAFWLVLQNVHVCCSGVVQDFDRLRHRHTVSYQDGDIEIIPLWAPNQMVSPHATVPISSHATVRLALMPVFQIPLVPLFQ